MNRTLGIYCLYDKMTKEYMPVFQMHNNDSAIRNIIHAHLKGNVEFPDDVHLIKLGELQIIEGNDVSLVNGNIDLGSISSLAEKFGNETRLKKYLDKRDNLKDPEILNREVLPNEC